MNITLPAPRHHTEFLLYQRFSYLELTFREWVRAGGKSPVFGKAERNSAARGYPMEFLSQSLYIDFRRMFRFGPWLPRSLVGLGDQVRKQPARRAVRPQINLFEVRCRFGKPLLKLNVNFCQSSLQHT